MKHQVKKNIKSKPNQQKMVKIKKNVKVKVSSRKKKIPTKNNYSDKNIILVKNEGENVYEY